MGASSIGKMFTSTVKSGSPSPLKSAIRIAFGQPCPESCPGNRSAVSSRKVPSPSQTRICSRLPVKSPFWKPAMRSALPSRLTSSVAKLIRIDPGPSAFGGSGAAVEKNLRRCIRARGAEVADVEVDAAVVVDVRGRSRVTEPRLGWKIRRRVDQRPVRRRKRECVWMARKRRRIIAVVSDEDVISVVAVEVGNDDLAAELRPCRWPRPHRRTVLEAAVPVGKEDADRMRDMRGRKRDSGEHDIRQPVFDKVFRSEGIRVIKAPLRAAPRARAHAERWVGSLRRECLDRLLILGRRQLERVVHVYATHYNAHRPHRSLGQRPPLAKPPPIGEPALTNQPIPLDRLRRRDQLGGLLHEYELAA